MPITVPLQKEYRMPANVPAGVTCLRNFVQAVCVHSIFIKTAKKYEDKVKNDLVFTWNRLNGYPAIIVLYRQCCLNNPRSLQLPILHSLLQTVK